MISLQTLQEYLADLLEISSFDDYCINGLQVEGRREIRKIITGVSASERLFRAAVHRKADAIIVHHGLFWRNTPHPLALVGVLGRRVKLLHQNEISLLGYHLPLDAHSEIGNNALIAKTLGLQNIVFVPIAGMERPCAAVGNLSEPVSSDAFFEKADNLLGANGLGLSFNRSEIRRIFILSGGGGGYYLDAANTGADLMITGELREDVVRSAEELGLNLYAAGHYNSEKWGIMALGEKLMEQFDVETEFVDIPNPV
ncbi:MAG: Nif3-like dinuclear metal center hexameric protein [Candidatus Electryoneaceae bacterium]|nr:Nif3-like dinuclear metal center hexameric protein [Candidatus Electryoneaceae bacterium]